MYHKQDWYDREFGLKWARDIHWPTDFDECVHRVMDSVRLDLAIRALNQMSSERRRTSRVKKSHTKLNDEGLEGQLRHWYLTPIIGWRVEHVKIVVLVQKSGGKTDFVTRIANLEVDIVTLYICPGAVVVRNGVCGEGRDATRAGAHQRRHSAQVSAVSAMAQSVRALRNILYFVHVERHWYLPR